MRAVTFSKTAYYFGISLALFLLQVLSSCGATLRGQLRDKKRKGGKEGNVYM